MNASDIMTSKLMTARPETGVSMLARELLDKHDQRRARGGQPWLSCCSHQRGRSARLPTRAKPTGLVAAPP
jgi:hypothetical protein